MSMAKQLISKLLNVQKIESSSDENATEFYQQVTKRGNRIGVGVPSLPQCFASWSQQQAAFTAPLSICIQPDDHLIFNE